MIIFKVEDIRRDDFDDFFSNEENIFEEFPPSASALGMT